MWICSKCGAKVDADFEICWACGASADGVEDPTFCPETEGIIEANRLEPTAAPKQGIKWVTITSFSLFTQAHVVRCLLEAKGIPVFLADEYTVSMDWLLSNAVGGIKVQVPEEDVDRALEILVEQSPKNRPWTS